MRELPERIRQATGSNEFAEHDLDDLTEATQEIVKEALCTAPLAGPDLDLLALDDALQKLEAKDKRKADLVKLRFFAGLTIEEAAQALGISTSTADNDWAYSRCWLRVEMQGEDSRQ